LFGKHLGNAAPPDIPDQDALLVFDRFAPFSVESMDKLNGRDVVPAFLLQRAPAERILWPDVIIVRV
jgi:hypothetical protein